jgi:hypothetical protein
MPEFICCIVISGSYYYNYYITSKKVLNKEHDLRHYNNYAIIKNNSNTQTTEFAYYITGLIEGDSTIYVPKTERSVKGNINYPYIQIVFHLKDLPLALLIQKELGHGSISKKKGQNAYIYTINNIDGLLLLVNLLNGKMKTNKIYTLNKLID